MFGNELGIRLFDEVGHEGIYSIEEEQSDQVRG